VGDRASKSAFGDMLEKWRKVLRKAGDDPLGDTPTEDISKKQLDAVLTEGDPEAAGLVQGAIEDFAQELVAVIRRFQRLKDWRDSRRIAVGGGFRASRVGELTIGRASVLLKAEKITVDLKPIRNCPDEAGLIGAIQLAPRWMFEGHEAFLAADIGGENRLVALEHPARRELNRSDQAGFVGTVADRYKVDGNLLGLEQHGGPSDRELTNTAGAEAAAYGNAPAVAPVLQLLKAADDGHQLLGKIFDGALQEAGCFR